jgi:CBS domain-containing protein
MREKEIQEERIRHLSLDPAVCLQSGISLHEVVEKMRKEHSSCVLICEGERLAGIFTERDYLNKVLSAGTVDRKRPIDDFMSVRPKTLSLDDTVGEAIKIMNEFGFRNVPLVDQQGKCTGLLQIRNIIQFLAELFPEEVLNVASRPETFRETDGA